MDENEHFADSLAVYYGDRPLLPVRSLTDFGNYPASQRQGLRHPASLLPARGPSAVVPGC